MLVKGGSGADSSYLPGRHNFYRYVYIEISPRELLGYKSQSSMLPIGKVSRLAGDKNIRTP